ncbi:MAG: biotin/lipoyl-containing protein, partial [bacterium]
VKAAKAAGYYSAGTVEFLRGDDGSYYFMEVNARLQVEHPVTEMITGVDLVELMIRVAAGERLELRQSDVGINGWAMEARIYAENPFRDFLPSSGRLTRYRPPPTDDADADANAADANADDANADDDTDATNTNPRIRLDSGVEEGSEISRFYDPMIAKLITWGADRAAAIARMRDALDCYYIRGVDTNQPFLSAIFAHPKFRQGELRTDFIAREYADGFAPMSRARMIAAGDDLGALVAVAATLHDRFSLRAAATSGQLPAGYGRAVGARWVVEIDGEYHPAQVHRAQSPAQDSTIDATECRVECGDAEYIIAHDWRATEPVFRARVNGARFNLQVERRGHDYDLARGGNRVRAKVLSPRAAELHALMPRKAPPDLSRFLLSPMPGLLVSLSVQAGDAVKAGQELAVIEAMKMENELRAEHDGVVERVLAQTGATLEADQMILEFAAQTNDAA